MGDVKDAVAPYTGAWIEIHPAFGKRRFGKSLPTRERGLKSFTAYRRPPEEGSLPTRERGLK